MIDSNQFAQRLLEDFWQPLCGIVSDELGGDEAIAEDIVQLTFFYAIKEGERWRDDESLLSWLIDITKLNILYEQGAKCNRPGLADLSEHPAPEQPDYLIRKEELELLNGMECELELGRQLIELQEQADAVKEKGKEVVAKSLEEILGKKRPDES